MKLEIIYRDEYLVAINKPHDLLVHRTKLAKDADFFALQLLRDQIDKHVYPIHRLDRKTAGVLLFSLNEEMLTKMQRPFANRQVSKKYLGIVRGFTENAGTINHPLKKDNGEMQEAITEYRTLDRSEIDLPSGKHETSRYSLIEITPLTGRQHQIRRHLAHIHHPIIADRPHGCNKQNKLFLEKFGLMTMMLHASELRFSHPVHDKEMTIKAGIQHEFKRMIQVLGFENNNSLQ